MGENKSVKDPLTQPKRIDFNSGRFTANGHEYIITPFLTIGRDVRFTNLVPRMVFGADFKSMFDTLSKIQTYCTTGDSSLAAISKIHPLALNQMEAIKNFKENGYPAYLELCALFINREGEDVRQITDDQVKQKIQDWEAEGIATDDFFLLAINSVADLKRRWQEFQEKANSSQTT